jgi:hypothetical protein
VPIIEIRRYRAKCDGCDHIAEFDGRSPIDLLEGWQVLPETDRSQVGWQGRKVLCPTCAKPSGDQD